MEKIKVNKDDLIKTLKVNRAEHLKEYDIAIEGFKIAVKKALAKKMKESKNLPDGKINDFNMAFYNLITPESHEEDFDTVIGMLEISTEKEVFINVQEYKQYYLNEWSWARNWHISNSMNFDLASSTPSSKYYVDGK